jgi:anti-anti-sigma regulatory factor
MFSLEVVQSTETAVLQCKGRLVRSDAAYRLRDMVTAQRSARVVALDFSEVVAVEGGGLGMLVFLQRWTRDNGIELQLFNPAPEIRHSLQRVSAICDLHIISEVAFLGLLGCHERQVASPVCLPA